jgi:hypothetical protein
MISSKLYRNRRCLSRILLVWPLKARIVHLFRKYYKNPISGIGMELVPSSVAATDICCGYCLSVALVNLSRGYQGNLILNKDILFWINSLALTYLTPSVERVRYSKLWASYHSIFINSIICLIYNDKYTYSYFIQFINKSISTIRIWTKYEKVETFVCLEYLALMVAPQLHNIQYKGVCCLRKILCASWSSLELVKQTRLSFPTMPPIY